MTTQKIIQEDIDTITRGIEKEAQAFEGKTILISGGAGFLGNYFVAALLHLNKKILKKPCRVIAVDNFITGTRKNGIAEFVGPDYEFIEHDVRYSIPSGISADYVIHAAGLASPFYYQKFPLETIEVAINGTKNFLEFAREKQVRGFLYFSSSEVYGDPDPNFIPTPEKYWGNVSALGPRACYDESKRLGETLCMTYYGLYGVPVKVVRPFNIYGPGMKIDDYRVIPTFMVKALKRKPLSVHDQGYQTRTFCYVADAIQGFLKALIVGRSGEVYNIGRNLEEINMMDLAKMIGGLFSEEVKVELVRYPKSYPAGEPRRRCPDISKAQKELGFAPTVDLNHGLSRTLSWYRGVLSE